MIDVTVKLPVEHLDTLVEFVKSLNTGDIEGECAARFILGEALCDALAEQLKQNARG